MNLTYFDKYKISYHKEKEVDTNQNSNTPPANFDNLTTACQVKLLNIA